MKAAVTFPASSEIKTAALASWARGLLVAGDDKGSLQSWLESKKASPAVMKAATAPVVTSDTDHEGLLDTQQVATGFVELSRNVSAFARLLNDRMMTRLPLRSRVTWMTGAATMGVVGETQAIKVSRFTSDASYLTPQRASGIIVISDTFADFMLAGGEAFLSAEFRKALSAIVDGAFFDDVIDGSTPTRASVGSSAEAAISDFKFLLDEVEPTANSRLLFAMAPDVARRAATLYDDGLVFPGMGPQGGTVLNTPALVTDGLSAGTVSLIDGSGLAGEIEGIQLTSARHASVQLDDAPDSPATASTTLVNLWQHNLRGVKADCYFATNRLRAAAVATVSAVAWGSANSPA